MGRMLKVRGLVAWKDHSLRKKGNGIVNRGFKVVL